MGKLLRDLALLTGLLFSFSAQSNLVDIEYGIGAGSFELGNFSTGGVFDRVTPTSPIQITGWMVVDTNVDWLKEPIWNADTGNLSVDLSGSANGAIATTIPTMSGEHYELSFATAAFEGFFGGSFFNCGNTGQVSAGSLDQEFMADCSDDVATQAYKSFSFIFMALNTETMITFAATDIDERYGPVIDSVVVNAVPAIPIPAAAWLFGTALIGLIGFSRHRKKVIFNQV